MFMVEIWVYCDPLKNLDAQKFYKVLPILGTQFLNPG